MKKFLLLLIPILLLSSCGEDVQKCDDNKDIFPDENYKVIDFDVSNTYNFDLDNPLYNYEKESRDVQSQLIANSNHTVIPSFDALTSTQRRHTSNANPPHDNIITYAYDTALEKTAQLNFVRYNKLFDGQISCVGENANSRLSLYSNGIIIDLNKRLEKAEAITLYLSHNILYLKTIITVSLYKNVNNVFGARPSFDVFNFNFHTNLGVSAAGPKFFYLDLTKILEDVSILNDTQMIGFSYTRLEPTTEEKATGQFAKYYPTLDDEIAAKNERIQSFVKLYDIGLPHSKWR